MATKLKVRTGDPKKGGELKEEVKYTPGRTQLDDTADLRDLITGMVGKGYTDLSTDDAKSNYSRLRSLVGDATANKLMTHVFIQNQRPGAANLPVEAKIKEFYEIPSADTDISNVLGKVKTFGYGVLPGFRESSSFTNQQLAGRIPGSTAMVDPAVSKIKLRVAQKTQ